MTKSDNFTFKPHIICQSCGGKATKDKVKLEDFVGEKMVMLDDVDAYICESCGELWVDDKTIKEFEKMLNEAEKRQRRK